MRIAWKSINPVACLMLVISAGYALCMTGHGLLTMNWESIAVLLALGGLLSWHVLALIPRHADLPYQQLPLGVVRQRPVASASMTLVTKTDGYIAWGILVFFALVALIPAGFSSDFRFAVALWLFFLAPACYLLGRRSAFLLTAPLAVFLIVIPMQEALFLVVSQPLRLIATMLSVEGLRIFGVEVSYNLTTIALPDVRFGITDACSGIQQLEALLLLGYLLVRWQQDGLWWRVFHYAFIVPSVILANVIRLMSVVLLYKLIGPRVLDSDWHSGLGYVQVLLAIGALWGFGCAVALLRNACAVGVEDAKGGQKK